VTTTTLAACTPVTGSARTFTVGLDVPEGLVVQGVTILLDYPEAQVTIPGSGAAPSVKQSVTALQAGTLATPNDLDVALRESVASLSGTLAVGPLFRVTFQDCQGATPPAPGDFGCTVESTSDPFGNSVVGVTCDVSSP
jgi:hypothetical protein